MWVIYAAGDPLLFGCTEIRFHSERPAVRVASHQSCNITRTSISSSAVAAPAMISLSAGRIQRTGHTALAISYYTCVYRYTNVYIYIYIYIFIHTLWAPGLVGARSAHRQLLLGTRLHYGPKIAPRYLQLSPRWPKTAPRWPAPRRPKVASRCCKIATRCLKLAPSRPQGSPRGP